MTECDLAALGRGPFSPWVIESYHDGTWILAANLMPNALMDRMLLVLQDYQQRRLGPHQDDSYRLRNIETGDCIMGEIL